MKASILRPLILSATLLLPFNAMAQTAPITPGGIPGIGGIGGIFGGGDRARESTQLAHMAMHEAGNAARLEALLKQLIAMPQSGTAGVVGNIQALLGELARMQQSFKTIYDDPSAYGTHDSRVEYKRRQLERQTARLEEMAATSATIDAKVRSVSTSADELATLNKGAPGGLAAQQIGNEAALLQLDLERQDLLVSQEIWRSMAQQEARDAENEALEDARACTFWGVDFYQSGTCQ